MVATSYTFSQKQFGTYQIQMVFPLLSMSPKVKGGKEALNPIVIRASLVIQTF